MMLTPEQMRDLRSKVAFWSELKRKDAISLFDHIDAQQARIAEWETLRDPNVLHANLLRGIPAKLSADQLLHIAGDKYQAMAARIAELEQDAANAAAAERERIKKICGDVIDEWFNCAGGADEVLRRIEEYEQNGETKP